jgi:membrane dipeptidase
VLKPTSKASAPVAPDASALASEAKGGARPKRVVDRRQFLRAGALAGLHVLAAPALQLGRCRLFGESAIEVSTRAIDVVRATTVIDMLGLITLDWSQLYRWQRTPTSFGEPDFRLLESSGIQIFHPAVETGAKDAVAGARRWLAGWTALLESQPCFLARIGSLNDLLLQPKLGKIGLLLGFQNSTHFRTAGDVGTFHALGQRVSQLTYNKANALGNGCFVKRDTGLTEFGAEVVREMNEFGMAIDVSHCGERTTLEAIGASRKPVLVTHSNCLALVPGQPRCKSDAVIRLMAAGGGVMGITMVAAFVHRRASPTLDDLLDHFDYVAKLVGVEHVGLGSDVDVEAMFPATRSMNPIYAIRGLSAHGRVFQLTEGLLRRGYSQSDVALVLGGNFRRALASIWPETSWRPVPERETRRDPFCPAPRFPELQRRAAAAPRSTPSR